MNGLYRDGTDGARRELGERWQARVEAAARLPRVFRRTYARRYARAVAGGVLAAVAVAMFACAAMLGARGGLFTTRSDGTLTMLLLHAWVAAVGAYVVTNAWARRRFDRTLARALAPTGELYADLDRARHEAPVDVAAAIARRPARLSLALPLIGLSLALPLTLHLAVCALFSSGRVDLAEFDGWIASSALLVGHSHVVLAVCAWFWARKVHRVGWKRAKDPLHAWLWTTLSSAVPGLMLFGVPVVLVAVTGAFIPLVFPMVAIRFHFERELIG